ncbi:hypothetical protein MNV84_08423 [Leishmania braziliensis]|nr:hypothetical protein MNV84_08423 [Leishmania braziliensis]CAJ2482270.1 unnamed protein product [Leishmania braziliensis]
MMEEFSRFCSLRGAREVHRKRFAMSGVETIQVLHTVAVWQGTEASAVTQGSFDRPIPARMSGGGHVQGNGAHEAHGTGRPADDGGKHFKVAGQGGLAADRDSGQSTGRGQWDHSGQFQFPAKRQCDSGLGHHAERHRG